MKSRLILTCTALLAMAGIADASTIEDFFRNREISNVQLSPDGKYLTHQGNFFAERHVIDRYKEIGDFLGTYLNDEQ